MAKSKTERSRMLLVILLRSLFIQALWNFERLQNVGFAYALLPFLKKHFPDSQQRKEVIMRHMGFFNTHPYMAGIIFGIVASLEEDNAKGKAVKIEEITAIKNNMAGPLAAIGDTFFWATWKPFVALLSIGLLLFFLKLDNFQGRYLAPLFFLSAYNLIHLLFRYWSLKIGYLMRGRIVEIIADMEFNYAVDLVRFIGVIILGLVVIFYIFDYSGSLFGRITYLGIFLFTIISGYFRLTPSIVFFAITLSSISFVYLTK